MCILVESNYSEKNTEGREKNPIDHLLFAPLVRDPFFNFFFFWQNQNYLKQTQERLSPCFSLYTEQH